MKNTITSLLLLLSTCIGSQPVISLNQYATGFTGQMSDIAHTTDGRLFVVEQMGYIRIIQPNGIVPPRPFLNIHTKVTPTHADSVGEQGLLGVAFSPNYATDGYFYVHYTNKTGVGNGVIARYRISTDPDSADAASEQILLTIYQPYSNHNGGCLQFGPDGFLYIGLGDGGSGGDPGNRAQNLDSLLGKMLRLDVSGGGAYIVPPSNPFVNTPGARPEIWAYGLRNPWRFSFDRLSGDLWIGDVGQQIWEEIDFQSANSMGGENYGWRCYEGKHAFNTNGCGALTSYSPPVYEYSHNPISACSVTGGYVYRGSAFPSLYGYYFYADFCNSTIYTLTTDGNFTSAVAAAYNGRYFSTFGENNAGELFIADRSSGTIYQITGSPNAIEDPSSDVFQTSIYPTPNSGNFICEFMLQESSPVAITITDLAGKQIYQLDKSGSLGKNSFPVEMEYLTTGFYLLQIKAGKHSACKRFSVQQD